MVYRVVSKNIFTCALHQNMQPMLYGSTATSRRMVEDKTGASGASLHLLEVILFF